MSVLEKIWKMPHAYVAILVYGSTEYSSTIFGIPRWVIGPAAEKRYTIWRPRYDQFTLLTLIHLVLYRGLVIDD